MKSLRVQIKNYEGLKSNRGLISLDFLFGFMLSFAFLMIFFALAYSLTIVEVIQYVAFASSRTYIGADVNAATQAARAQAKATSLVKQKFAQVLGPSWFSVGAGGSGILKTISSDQSVDANGSPQFFIGVQIPLTIHLLDFRLPFFGRTKATNAGDGFQTLVSSYLIREPTQAECLHFNDQRASYIINVGNGGTPPANYPTFGSFYWRVSDNGC